MRVVGAGVAAFLGWAFQGVGPATDARAAMEASPPTKVGGLGLLFGDEPTVAIYCGAKVRRASYAPLAQSVAEKTGSGVLVLQSPQFAGLCVYAKKPANVEKVLERFPTVTCIAGHSIGGLWAAEFCRDLFDAGKWPSAGLDFVHLGVHGKGVSLSPFRILPFRKVGWTVATQDCTMLRAAEGDVTAYVERVVDELPKGSTIFELDGGNHEQYGDYGSPGPAQGLAYKDNPATMPAEEQREVVAEAIALIARGGEA